MATLHSWFNVVLAVLVLGFSMYFVGRRIYEMRPRTTTVYTLMPVPYVGVTKVESHAFRKGGIGIKVTYQTGITKPLDSDVLTLVIGTDRWLWGQLYITHMHFKVAGEEIRWGRDYRILASDLPVGGLCISVFSRRLGTKHPLVIEFLLRRHSWHEGDLDDIYAHIKQHNDCVWVTEVPRNWSRGDER